MCLHNTLYDSKKTISVVKDKQINHFKTTQDIWNGHVITMVVKKIVIHEFNSNHYW